MQKAFHPEPDGTCHVVVLHPPGGLVGGDDLSLGVEVGAEARVLLTTPAATKLYRSAGPRAAQRQALRGARASRLEWLPNETIVFDGAQALLGTRVVLDAGADFLGWDLVCLGRPASGERFGHGRLRQSFEVWREGRPLYVERARYEGGSEALDRSWGLGGEPVVGVLVCVAAASCDDLVARMREVAAPVARARFGATRLDSALVARYVGPSVEEALGAFRAVRRMLRSSVWGSPPCEPRIWLT